MKLSQLLGRDNERAIYRNVTEAERQANREQVRIIREYRAKKRQEAKNIAKASRRRELLDAGFIPPENF